MSSAPASHVVIAGAGVIGLAAAHRLARSGARVTVLERGEIGRGCSAGNLGWICPSIALPIPAPGLRAKGLRWFARPDSPLYIKPSALPALTPWLARFWQHCTGEAFDRGTRALTAFAADAVELYEELAGELDGMEWHRDGLLMAFRDEKALDEEVRLIEGHGYRGVERLDEKELLALEPALPHGRFCGGIFMAPEGHVEPLRLTAALAAGCRALDVEVVEGFRVDELLMAPRSGQARGIRGMVDGEPAECEADEILIATGAEAGPLATASGACIPLEAGKGYSITIARPELELRRPIYLAEEKLGLTPFDDALRVAGTLELSGINRDLDRRRLASIERVAERGVPGSTRGGTRRDWVGMRPLTPDGLPVIGRLPGADNVWLATGHQMLGVTLAPATARLLAARMLGKRDPALDPTATALFERAFSPDRFA